MEGPHAQTTGIPSRKPPGCPPEVAGVGCVVASSRRSKPSPAAARDRATSPIARRRPPVRTPRCPPDVDRAADADASASRSCSIASSGPGEDGRGAAGLPTCTAAPPRTPCGLTVWPTAGVDRLLVRREQDLPGRTRYPLDADQTFGIAQPRSAVLRVEQRCAAATATRTGYCSPRYPPPVAASTASCGGGSSSIRACRGWAPTRRWSRRTGVPARPRSARRR
jgi:hypothetical protein